MKTSSPREILLHRHRAAERKLDRLRMEVLSKRPRAGQAAGLASDAPLHRIPGWLRWQVQLPALAASWILIAFLHGTTRTEPAARRLDPATSGIDFHSAMAEQQRLLAELRAWDPAPADAEPKPWGRRLERTNG